MKKKKAFDCVDMMHRGAERIYEETKNLTRKAELAYWRKKAVGLSKRGRRRALLHVSESHSKYRHGH